MIKSIFFFEIFVDKGAIFCYNYYSEREVRIMKKKINLIKIILIIITTAIVFYNIGISVTLKNLQPHAVGDHYEVTVFGETFIYED